MAAKCHNNKMTALVTISLLSENEREKIFKIQNIKESTKTEHCKTQLGTAHFKLAQIGPL